MKARALRAAFPYTLPILTGFAFLGLTYGVYMQSAGFSFVYPMAMSAIIFGGSLEFVAVELLLSPFAPLATFAMALMIQLRHLFYGISMLEKYKGTGRKKLYLIYGMCDESFSINCTAVLPPDVDRGWFYFFVTLLNQAYWVLSATLGGLLGTVLKLRLQGVGFVMTAMFVVIFLDRWKSVRNHIPALVGLGATAGSLILFGADSFLIPAMCGIIGILWLLRKPLERRGV